MMKRSSLFLAVVFLAFSSIANAQHIFWSTKVDGKPLHHFTMMYGEIKVLATGPNIYYCGINWHPGEPGGGYCGIQDNSNTERRMIFSMWDTSPKLHPKVTQHDPRTDAGRFGGEGTGAHTHMVYPWKVGQTFKYCVTKQPDKSGKNTLTTFYFYDQGKKHWVLGAAISSPTDNHDSLRYFGGGMNSFLEHFGPAEPNAPKLCLYRLWAGTAPDNLQQLRYAKGDVDKETAHWGILEGSYYLAAGNDPAKLSEVIKKQPNAAGDKLNAKKGEKLPPIPAHKISKATIQALKNLPNPNGAK